MTRVMIGAKKLASTRRNREIWERASVHPSRFTRMSQELPETTAMKERGGARVGDGLIPINYSWPFAVISADDQTLTVRIKVFFFSRVYSLAKADIIRLVGGKGLMGHGFQIEHSDRSHPSHMIFWCFRPKKLVRELRDLGYPVHFNVVGVNS